MNYTQSKGNVVELQCISKCIELGYECSIPYGNGAKYDFIVDVNGQFLRVQCKSCFRPINKATRKADRPPREELKKMIREESFIQIGKNFNVTDNAIRKWCDAYNLPRTKKEIKKYSDEDWEKI